MAAEKEEKARAVDEESARAVAEEGPAASRSSNSSDSSDSSDFLTSLSNPEVYLTLGTLAGMAVVGLLFLGCAAMRKPDSSRGKHQNDARYGTQEEQMDLKFST